MSIAHLHYCLHEIDTIARFLQVKNSTFFKRSTSRLIAVRVDDFIKLGFAANKETVKSKPIKNELNALKDLYYEYFKLLRDKYGAHFQYLDFSTRLRGWSAINLETASFFTEMPAAIYANFAKAPGYIPFIGSPISPDCESLIVAMNQDFDLESRPTLATDILALTRPNTGGILNFSMIHTKAGVLKSLELLMDYEWAVINTITCSEDVRRAFIKLFVTDLVSYADNFYTRTDIPAGAPQDEKGFDYHFAQDDHAIAGNEMIAQLQRSFKITEHTDELRVIRNKACGHIDTSYDPVQLNDMVDSVDLQKFYDFYSRMRNVFKSVCHKTIYLREYLFDPYEPLRGVVEMKAMEVTSFDGTPFTHAPLPHRSADDLDEYEKAFADWLRSEDDEARSYFWDCFGNAELEERIEIEEPTPGGGSVFRYYDYRKVHRFFEEKLKGPGVPETEKIAIINLFINCRSGYTTTLVFILARTYPENISLQVHYIRALGTLSDNRTDQTLRRCDDLFRSTNLQGKCIALRAVLGIDIRARRNHSGKHNTEESTYSAYLVTAINLPMSHFSRMCLSLALLSDLVFERHFIYDQLDGIYRNRFIDLFIKASDKILSPYLKTGNNRERLTEIQNRAERNYFCTVAALMSELLESKDFKKEAQVIQELITQDYILFARDDDQELHNFAVIHFRLKNIEGAIQIATFLTEKNAHKADHNYLLLQIYSEDEKYRDAFTNLKKKILDTFNLTKEERKDFEDLVMTL